MTPIVSRERVALIVLFVVGGIIQAGFVLTESLSFLVRTDDAFYYFEIAKNFPVYRTFTFDGIHATNGVQPLWALILAGVSSIVQAMGIQEPVILARIFLSVAVSFNVAAAWFLANVARKLWDFATSLVVASLWLLSPRLVLQQLAGMENALYAFCLAVLLWFMVSRFDPEQQESYAFLGGLLGLTFLARIDAVLLIPVMVVWLSARLGLSRYAMHRLGMMLATASAIVIPYLAYNLIAFSHLLPVSGAIKRYYSESLVASLGGHVSFLYFTFLAKEVLGSLLRMVYALVASLMIETLFYYLLKWRPADLHAVYRGATSTPLLAAIALATVAVIQALYMRRSWMKRSFANRHQQGFRQLDFFTVFAVIQFLSYVALYPGYLLRNGVQWYFVPAYITLVLGVACPATYALGCVRRTQNVLLRGLSHGIALIILVNLTLFYGLLIHRDFPPDVQMTAFRAAQWMNVNTTQGTVIGAFNAGVLGYFSERPVVNLDGMVADYTLLNYLERGTLWTYIRCNEIEYIADWRPIWRPYEVWLTHRGIPVRRVQPIRAFFSFDQRYIFHILRTTPALTEGDCEDGKQAPK